ncbi:MAG TPA: fasciclin domain-containing protein [Nocardioidaceae bacterium]|nr:fasciclin domain-containing protein [Nocardioidaceae bacterium]
MSIRTAAIGVTTLLASAAIAVPAAAPAAAAPGTTSLATVLAADGNRFDRNHRDFDILDRAVRTVLKAKPGSPVAVLADGNVRLTAFIPTDRAFMRLVRSLTGKTPATEKATFAAVASVADVDMIETILLYHVVPGVTIRSKAAAQADGAVLPTAQGGTLTVNVRPNSRIFLRDKDKDAANPELIPALLDINKGNKQIAHGINRVLRPIDL